MGAWLSSKPNDLHVVHLSFQIPETGRFRENTAEMLLSDSVLGTFLFFYPGTLGWETLDWVQRGRWTETLLCKDHTKEGVSWGSLDGDFETNTQYTSWDEFQVTGEEMGIELYRDVGTYMKTHFTVQCPLPIKLLRWDRHPQHNPVSQKQLYYTGDPRENNSKQDSTWYCPRPPFLTPKQGS